MTVDELICWQHELLREANLDVTPTHEVVAQALSDLDRARLPRGAGEALTKFRHLRQDARVQKVRAALGAKKYQKRVAGIRLANAVDKLNDQGTAMTLAIEGLVDAKLEDGLRRMLTELSHLGQEIRALRQEMASFLRGHHER